MKFKKFSLIKYSRHPNTESLAVFGLYLMPVPIIRISNRPKTGHLCQVTSLGRFVNKSHKKYFNHAKMV
jgi:hypothetical protein